jgi:hypothetical protein
MLLIAYCLLSLSLLEAGILFVNNIQLALAANDLAISTAFFNGCSYFHNYFLFLIPDSELFISEYYPSPRQVIRRHFYSHFISRQNADIVHSHFPRDGCQYFVAIFQLYPEHGIRKRFYDRTILFNKGLFRHIFLGTQR